MRRAWVAGIIAIVLLVVAGIPACEDEEQSETPASTQPAGPTQPQFQRLKLTSQPATLPMPPPDWKPATEPATTGPSTRLAATESSLPTSRKVDPLETPDSALRYFLDLCGREQLPDIDTMRRIIVEFPDEEAGVNDVVGKLNRYRARLLRGATWEIVQTHRRDAAATVIVRMNLRGRESIGQWMLLQGHDDRWRVILGELTPVKYTPGEKEAMKLETAWAQDRVSQLTAAAATQQAASQPSTEPAR